MVVSQAMIRSVSKCQICILKEQGVVNPEEHVLQQYYLSVDPTAIPTPVDADVSLEAGILVLNPEEGENAKDNPQSGGFFGTVRSLFKAIGFIKPPEEVPVSKEVATRKRRRGLYE